MHPKHGYIKYPPACPSCLHTRRALKTPLNSVAMHAARFPFSWSKRTISTRNKTKQNNRQNDISTLPQHLANHTQCHACSHLVDISTSSLCPAPVSCWVCRARRNIPITGARRTAQARADAACTCAPQTGNGGDCDSSVRRRDGDTIVCAIG